MCMCIVMLSLMKTIDWLLLDAVNNQKTPLYNQNQMHQLQVYMRSFDLQVNHLNHHVNNDDNISWMNYFDWLISYSVKCLLIRISIINNNIKNACNIIVIDGVGHILLTLWLLHFELYNIVIIDYNNVVYFDVIWLGIEWSKLNCRDAKMLGCCE